MKTGFEERYAAPAGVAQVRKNANTAALSARDFVTKAYDEGLAQD